MIKTVDQDSHPRIADFINTIDPKRTRRRNVSASVIRGLAGAAAL